MWFTAPTNSGTSSPDYFAWASGGIYSKPHGALYRTNELRFIPTDMNAVKETIVENGLKAAFCLYFERIAPCLHKHRLPLDDGEPIRLTIVVV